MLWPPAVRFETIMLAVPPLKAEEPSEVVPSKNSMVPVGVPAGEVRVAVKVTGSVKRLGLAEEAKTRLVGKAFTTCGTIGDVLIS